MSGSPDDKLRTLTLQLLGWIDRPPGGRPRTYAEAMDAWRSTCPRLTIWDDALLEGLIQVNGAPIGGVASKDEATVTLTPSGRAMLDQRNAHARNS